MTDGPREPRFSPERFEVEETTVDGKKRFSLFDAARGTEIRLGEHEYEVARAFDGARDPEAISRGLAEKGLRCAPETIVRLRDRLLSLGILERVGGADEKAPRLHPYTGRELKGLERFLVVRLFEVRGDRWLVRLLDLLPFLGRAWFFWALVAIGTLGVGILILDTGGFIRSASGLDLGAWRFWVIMIGVGAAANALHELGHAVAIRAQGVRVFSIGFALNLAVVSGFTRPGRDYRNLGRKGRLACLAAGPVVSFAVAAPFILAAHFSDPGSREERDLMVAFAASVIGALISLVPFHTGDGYLLVTELFGIENLRQRARETLIRVVSKRAWPDSRASLGLFAFGLAVLLWRAALIALVVYLVAQIARD